MLGVLQRLLLGCCGLQSCHKHAVPFLEVSKFLTSFLTAVLKIYIDWLALISARCPTEMTVLSMSTCDVRVSTSVSIQLGTSLPVITHPTERHSVFEILKTVEFCGNRWLDTEEGLDVLCREWCSQSALETPRGLGIWRIPGFLIPLLTGFASLKTLAAA